MGSASSVNSTKVPSKANRSFPNWTSMLGHRHVRNSVPPAPTDPTRSRSFCFKPRTFAYAMSINDESAPESTRAGSRTLLLPCHSTTSRTGRGGPVKADE